jgi:hypothetical protein
MIEGYACIGTALYSGILAASRHLDFKVGQRIFQHERPHQSCAQGPTTSHKPHISMTALRPRVR